MVLQLDRVVVVLLLLALDLPVLLLLDVGGRDQHVVHVALALLDRLLDDLCGSKRTASRIRSGMPLSSGYRW